MEFTITPEAKYQQRLSEAIRTHQDRESAAVFYANLGRNDDLRFAADIYRSSSDPKLVMQSIQLYIQLRDTDEAKRASIRSRGLLQPYLNHSCDSKAARRSRDLLHENGREARERLSVLDEIDAFLSA